MTCISETRLVTLHSVQPRHTNPLGTLHGGVLMGWMTTTAAMAASRFSRGPVVLGTIDDVFFVNPVRVGELVEIESQVVYRGTSTMDLVVDVTSEDPKLGEKRVTTHATMAYIAVDDMLRPRRITASLESCTAEEDQLYREAEERYAERKRLLKGLKPEPPMRLKGLPTITTYRLVHPDDAYFGNWMSAASLLKTMDDVGGMLALTYARGVVVTGAVDRIVFHEPIYVGEILKLEAAVSYVGRTSIEVSISVEASNPARGAARTTCTSYFTFIHLGGDGRPRPVPSFKPKTPRDLEEWRRAEERRRARLERLKRFRERILSRGYKL